MNQRMDQIVDWLTQEQLQIGLINTPSNVYYLTGFECHPHERLLALFIFADQQPILVCPKMEVERVNATGFQSVVIGYDDTEDPWELIQAEFHKRGFTKDQSLRVAIEKESLSYARAMKVNGLFNQVEFESIEPVIHSLRVIKDELEIEIMREAARLADLGVEIGMKTLHVGITETEVVSVIEQELKKKGIDGMSFETMVLFGEKTALPHGTPGDRQLQKGDLVLFDLGVVWKGYCSDITRTMAFGSPTPEQERIYQTVLQANLTALMNIKPGIRMGELDRSARDVIRNAGYGDYFPHRLGHGLGIEVHEYPSLSETNQELLSVGMAFTVEPGIYVPNVGGVRIEDDVVVLEDGVEVLTHFPKELLVIEV